MNRRTLLPAAAACTLAAAVAGPAAAHSGHHETMNVSIAFQARAGATPVTCGNPITGLGTTATTAQLQDLRFYVSNVALVRANGRAVPVTLTGPAAYNVTRGASRVTLIDLENARGACSGGTPGTNAAVRGTVPEGTYTGVRFYVGVPFALNHSDTVGAPAPLDITAMTWSWQSGRKFTKIEVTDPAAGAPWAARSFFVHVGSTGCTGNPATGATVSCADSNRIGVRLKRFDPARHKIAVDIRALLAGNDITVNRGGAGGCMSGPTDPECLGVFAALGVDWKPDGSGTGAVMGGGTAQTVFRAVTR